MADERPPVPVAFREDLHFIYSVERLNLLFEEEKRFYAPPCIIPIDLNENARSSIFKWLQEFQFRKHGELETVPIVVNMMDRLVPMREDYQKEPLLTLLSCYSMATGLHDVVPVQVEELAIFLQRIDLVSVNVYNSLVILNDLTYNTRGLNPVDFMRTFVYYLLPLPSKPFNSTPSQPVASSSSSTSSTHPPNKRQSLPASTHTPNGWALSSAEDNTERLKLYREELLLKSVLNYNHSLHSTKLAQYLASEIAAACILRASSCTSDIRILFTEEVFIAKVPLLCKYHKPDVWISNVKAALKIVSKYSCADFRKTG